MTAPASVGIIDLDVAGPTISRHVYGHFAEHLGACVYGGFYVGPDSDLPNENGIRLDVVEALRALAIPNLRWPGGCFADEYHWRDGVGPREERPSMVNTNWGHVEESNHFGTHEFMQLAEMLGADAYINGNVGSGTVREMSEWVEYLTRADDSPMVRLRKANGREAPWRVPFWGIGNEPWGCGGAMRAEHYADLARQYARFCVSHGDNRLYRIAAGANTDDYAWTEALMRTIGKLGCRKCLDDTVFQAISVHYYTYPGTWEEKGSATEFGVEEYYETMASAWRIDRILKGHSAVMDCYDPDAKIGLVLDEWGTWWRAEEGTNPAFLYQQNTLRDALVASVHFDIFHTHARRLAMANIAQTVNVLQAMILTDGPELVLTPTYHVFEMNKRHQDAASLAVHRLGEWPTRAVAGAPMELVSASASVKDGRALMSLTNLDADAGHGVRLDLRGREASLGDARVLTAPELASFNAAGTAPVRPEAFDGATLVGGRLDVDLPPHSFVTIDLALA